MQDMTTKRWQYTNRYIQDMIPKEEPLLIAMQRSARAKEMPEISVGPEVGRFLELVVSMTRGNLALEIGTLGGYSAAWILRGMAPSGHLETIEEMPEYADFAEDWLGRLGHSGRFTIRRGAALSILPDLAKMYGPRSVDFVFVDADKLEYPAYLQCVTDLIRPGGLLVADNVLGTDDFWIDHEEHPERQAVDAFNRTVMEHPDYRAVILPIRQGLLMAQRK